MSVGPELRLNREGDFMARLEEVFFYCAELQDNASNKPRNRKRVNRYRNGIRVLITCMAGMPSRFNEGDIKSFREELANTNGYVSLEELHIKLATNLGAENVFERKKSDIGDWFVTKPDE